MTRSKSRASRQWVMQVVHVGSPDIKSAASLALLAKYYFPQDKTIYTNYRMMRIRHKWLERLFKTPDEQGGLTCAICKRQGLRPQKENPVHYITLDHILEISEGGSWNDESNFQVACNQCNHLKDAIRQRKLEKTS